MKRGIAVLETPSFRHSGRTGWDVDERSDTDTAAEIP